MTVTNNPETGDSDDGGGAYGEKLIPEWRVEPNDQVFWAGLAVAAALLLAVGWNIWRGGDDADLVATVTTLVETAGAENIDEATAEGGDQIPILPVTTDTNETSAASTSTTQASSTSTTEATPVIGDVQAAVAPLPGAITGSNDGARAILTGYVANQAESVAAAAAAAAVVGIASVDNQLVILEPEIVATLEAAGVTSPSASGQGTEITVSGTIDTEQDRQPTLDAVAAVPGVTAVTDDRLEVSVTADLNLLPQVQFATGSAEILTVSHGDLDSAARLLQSADPSIRIEIQGYTDVRGDEQTNLELSQARADAVRDYLAGAGVDQAMLTAEGYGETTQFAEGDTPDAYQANRLVRFQQTG